MARSLRRATLLGLLLAATAGCDRDESAHLPMPARGGPAATAGGSGRAATTAVACSTDTPFADRATAPLLPPRTGDFCLDPGSPERAIGDDTPRDIEQLCALIDGECEIYRRYAVRRVVEARYVAAAGSSASIDVFLSRYGASEMSYGMFTYRVVGDGDPYRSDAPTPLDVPGQATLGQGTAYLWHGPFLVELTLNDDQASASQIAERAGRLLPTLVGEIAKRLPGKSPLPEAAASLPMDARAPTGIRFFPKDMVGIEGAGAGAVGYFRDGEQRWRLARGVEQDVDRAQDAMRAIRKVPGAAEEKRLGDEATRILLPAGFGAPSAEWIFARVAGVVAGIGDESTVLVDGMSADRRRSLTLTTDAKRERLRAWLTEARTPPPAP